MEERKNFVGKRFRAQRAESKGRKEFKCQKLSGGNDKSLKGNVFRFREGEREKCVFLTLFGKFIRLERPNRSSIQRLAAKG